MLGDSSLDSQKPTILLVDDQPLLSSAIRSILVEDGFEVVEAASGYTALAALSKLGQVDVMITDVLMDGHMSGFALARRVAAERPGTHIIIMSGHLRPEPNDLPEGAIFVSKPLRPSQLSTTAWDLLGGRREELINEPKSSE